MLFKIWFKNPLQIDSYEIIDKIGIKVGTCEEACSRNILPKQRPLVRCTNDVRREKVLICDRHSEYAQSKRLMINESPPKKSGFTGNRTHEKSKLSCEANYVVERSFHWIKTSILKGQ